MKIAIVKLSALGDIVHAMVALQFIKAQYPDCQLDWVVEQGFAEVLRHNPHIDTILTVNLKALKKNRLAFFKEMAQVRRYAAAHYDWVIDAQGLLKSAITARLIGQRVAGFDSQSIREKAAAWLYQDKIACPYDANTIDRNAKVLSAPLGFAITPQQIINKQAFLFFGPVDMRLQKYLSKERKNIVLVVGSTWASRNYPAQQYVNVANALAENCLVIWGNAKEQAVAEWMAAQSPFIKALPKLDLNGLKTLIAHTDLLIGNDTGPTHFAWALNKPSITLFGPTPVSRVYQTDINRVIKSPSVVNPYRLNKQDFSIKDIPAAAVIAIARELLALDTHIAI